MDATCLEYALTEEERRQFEEDGYLIVRDVLPADLVAELIPVVDRLDAEYRPKRGLEDHQMLNLLDFIGKDELFLELLDWPQVFAKVFGLLGWHIQLYHSHMIVTPPLNGQEPKRKRLGWHQDSGRLNIDLETDPRPMISLKVAFFLTDCMETNRGNFHAVPGSHRINRIELPKDEDRDPEGAVPIRVAAGDAVFFDRRIWHAAGHNYSPEARKVLFYGYSYRWLRPRDDMTVEHFMARCDPIRQQLLGASPSGWHGYTSPREEDVPLREWIRENLGEEAVVR
ncbi:MAG: phytanoyl-CoA dioxygenase family protein [Candidatus Latescibacterota bacterium]|nr:phytanoyl-CoA dioxygenase family protein [Candidatus Latescibacterota bacterium]